MNIGLIGCGAISATYLTYCRHFSILDLVACADLNPAAAEGRGSEFGVPKVCSVETLLADPTIEMVLNLTVPAAHASVNTRALRHGKHAYCEKPFAVTRAQGRRVLELAKKTNLQVGCAPDTVLGQGIQTCRRLIDDGVIGKPTAATAFCCGGGHERWHPNPGFYYERGGGPLFDMGPYYLTALTVLLGPVRSVTAQVKKTFTQRTASSLGNEGLVIEVKTPTHLTGILEFRNGVLATTVFSFDVKGGANLPRIEIYGTEGTLSVPDPNRFDGPVSVKRVGETEWRNINHTHSYIAGRGIGLADTAHAIQSGRSLRASGELGYHVVDIMQSFAESSLSKQQVKIESSIERPDPMPPILPQVIVG